MILTHWAIILTHWAIILTHWAIILTHLNWKLSKLKLTVQISSQTVSKKSYLKTNPCLKICYPHNLNFPATLPNKSSHSLNFNHKRNSTKISNNKTVISLRLKNLNHRWILRPLLQEWTHAGPCYYQMIFMVAISIQPSLISCQANNVSLFINIRKKSLISKASSKDKPSYLSSKKKPKTNA
jgi:hypothetical protein